MADFAYIARDRSGAEMTGTITGPSAGTVAINITASSGLANGTYTLIDWTGATPSSVDVSDFAVTMPPNWVARLYIASSKLMLDVKAATSFIKFQ